MGSADLQITEVAGYRLAERIGSGGMGDVYKAYNASLNRVAAVKVLHQAAHTDRFKNEAYIHASIQHPNIACLYEYTTCGDKPCIIMEYIDGESLDVAIQKKGRFSSEETEHMLRQIASALAYLHKKDIMHRDIKPQNFKVQPDGTVKMLDFGIAKHKYSPKFTQLGFVVGTVEYLAPEQFEQKEELKTDVWCLAVMTYEMLTGYMPFEANNPLTLRTKISKGSFTNPRILVPGISEKLSVIIEKGLRVNPANRISAAGIENVLGRNKKQTNVNRLEQVKLPSKKILVPVISCILVILVIFFLANNKNPPTPIQADEIVKEADNKNETGNTKSVLINVPGINNAELITANDDHLQLPYKVTGKEGDKFEFTIRAEGYKDKKVQVVITPRRSSFEYNLEKNNN